MAKIKHISNPWDSEPTIWKAFCGEKNFWDENTARVLYKNNQMIKSHYIWFRKGFDYGGQS